MNQIIEKTLKALERNNMQGFYAETVDEARELALSLIPVGSTVANGGSVTLKEIGLLESIDKGDYTFIDRSLAKTPEELKEVYRKCFSADVYLSSTNALTTDGVLYNVDGTGNRIAAITYGPESIIIVVGKNKIVDSLSAAVERVKAIAAPPNCKRLSKETPCRKTGECIACKNSDSTKTDNILDGCGSPARICRDFLFTGVQAVKNRIKVIIVNEDLGY